MKVLSSLFTVIFAYFVVAKPIARRDIGMQAGETQVSTNDLIQSKVNIETETTNEDG